jgi:hypothetical protein
VWRVNSDVGLIPIRELNGNFVVSKAAGAYDMLAKGLRRKSRFSDLLEYRSVEAQPSLS